ncbi:phage tail protein [Peribacillus sp. NPDC097295]|uniref:phage tail-collar fiber domain-containing protein n=1 Tax=Peribacillus sp. NPDC097295 TaxID=3364402 RepID=UPI0037F15A12
MSAFGGLILTNRGSILQTKAQTGKPLKFTRIALGDGELSGASILDLKALKREVKSLNISKLKVVTAGQALIGSVLTNQDLTTGFYWRELGVFAEDPDTKEDVLYSYGNAKTNAEYIPAGGGSDIVEKTIDIMTLIGNTSNISATINQSLIFETPEGAQEKANAAKEAAMVTINDIKTNLEKSLATHQADEVSHIKATERTAWNANETPAGASEKDRISFEQTDFKVSKSNKDSNGIFTTVHYRRNDGKLAISSILSGGTSPLYATRTIKYYGIDGQTVEKLSEHLAMTLMGF